MLFEYSSLVAYRVGPSTTVGVRSVTAENLRESAATAKTIRCKTERPTTRPRTTSIQLTGQAKARQCADLSGAGTAVPRRACRGLARAAMGKHRLGKSKVSRSTVVLKDRISIWAWWPFSVEKCAKSMRFPLDVFIVDLRCYFKGPWVVLA